MDKLSERMAGMSESERREVAAMMDKELDEYIDGLEASSGKYMDGWNEDTWESEMENHPFFAKSAINQQTQELSPLMQGIQDLKYSSEDNTPEELAKNYKEDGNFQFKCKKYRFAIAAYSQGLKFKCGDTLLNCQLLTNRAAAQFHIGNFRSALMDCRMAHKISGDGHPKAILRAAQCCLELRRFDECFQWCDKGLSSDHQVETFREIRQKATEKKSETDRNERREAARLKKEKNEINKLLDGIKSRGIAIAKSKGCSDLTLENIEPTHPAAIRKRVHFDGLNLVWPVLFLYPEFGETDFIEEFEENQTFDQHVEAMFGSDVERPHWDQESKYIPDRIRIYFEDTENEKLVQVDTGKSLLSVLKDPRYRVVGGTPGFIILVDGSPFFKEFIMKYK